MAIKRKGWLLRKLTNPNRSITIWPHIYMGDPYWSDPTNPGWGPLIVHESTHLHRQAGSHLLWLITWRFNRVFRLNEEALAIAVEIQATRKINPQSAEWLFDSYVKELCGPEYYHAARTQEEAATAILKYMAWS